MEFSVLCTCINSPTESMRTHTHSTAKVCWSAPRPSSHLKLGTMVAHWNGRGALSTFGRLLWCQYPRKHSSGARARTPAEILCGPVQDENGNWPWMNVLCCCFCWRPICMPRKQLTTNDSIVAVSQANWLETGTFAILISLQVPMPVDTCSVKRFFVVLQCWLRCAQFKLSSEIGQ